MRGLSLRDPAFVGALGVVEPVTIAFDGSNYNTISGTTTISNVPSVPVAGERAFIATVLVAGKTSTPTTITVGGVAYSVDVVGDPGTGEFVLAAAVAAKADISGNVSITTNAGHTDIAANLTVIDNVNTITKYTASDSLPTGSNTNSRTLSTASVSGGAAGFVAQLGVINRNAAAYPEINSSGLTFTSRQGVDLVSGEASRLWSSTSVESGLSGTLSVDVDPNGNQFEDYAATLIVVAFG